MGPLFFQHDEKKPVLVEVVGREYGCWLLVSIKYFCMLCSNACSLPTRTFPAEVLKGPNYYVAVQTFSALCWTNIKGFKGKTLKEFEVAFLLIDMQFLQNYRNRVAVQSLHGDLSSSVSCLWRQINVWILPFQYKVVFHNVVYSEHIAPSVLRHTGGR
jgi:hypothetical protein